MQYTYNVYVSNTNAASAAGNAWNPNASGQTWRQT